MNKKLMAVTAVFVLALIGVTVYTIMPTKQPAAVIQAIATSSPKNATYTIAGDQVTLVDGSATTVVTPGSATQTTTRYFGNEATYDFNQDGRMDTAFLLTQSTGGSGTFYYIVAALATVDGYHGSIGTLLGDRIAPQTTIIRSYNGTSGLVEVTYVTRAPGEAFTVEPSVGASLLLRFDVASNQFVIIPTTTTTASTGTISDTPFGIK